MSGQHHRNDGDQVHSSQHSEGAALEPSHDSECWDIKTITFPSGSSKASEYNIIMQNGHGCDLDLVIAICTQADN